MALFDIPGWSIPDEPVAAAHKKRKRTSKQNVDKVKSATVNVEKLIEQLAAGPAAENTRRELKEGKSEGVSADSDHPPKRRRVKRNKARQSPTPSAVQEDGSHKASRKKRKKEKETSGEKVTGTPSSLESRPPPESRNKLTSLQHGMKQSLDGARFRYVIHHNFYPWCPTVLACVSKSRRWINEKLYKSDSADAHAMMREDPAVFDDVRSSMPLLARAHSRESTVSQGVPSSSRVLAV
jgi:ribosomal RNA-processing protein 8